MEQQRLLLFLALGIVLFMLWDAWQRDFGPEPVTPAPTTTTTTGAPTSAQQAETSGVPEGTDSVPVTAPAAQASAVPGQRQTGEILAHGQRIVVITDTVRAEIDTIGGDLRVVDLRKYPEHATTPDKPFRLMNDTLPLLFVSQSGFTRKKPREDGTQTDAPNHTTLFTAKNPRYEMAADEKTLSVDLSWRSADGIDFIKTYVFSRDSYVIKVRHTIKNPTAEDWRGNLYQQLQRNSAEEANKPGFIYTYTGGVVYSPEDKYQKIDFGEMEDADLVKNITGGWAAMIQHYFLGAWIPKADEPYTYYTQYLKDHDRYVIGMKSASEYRVAGGEQTTVENRMYVGPKLQSVLEQIAPGLELTVDYGMLTIIAKPLFWLLDKIHSFVNNWGWAIILLTLVIKLAFYKLSEASYKSMANMRRITPRIQALRERYADDRQQLSRAQMELFKKEKVNPLGGCLPILVQIPVFIALYWVLLESVELRQAEWILWIKDMSAADPYFILPVLMGVTMFFQQRLNPAPMDPIHAKVMMVLPIVFTVFFAFFPAGLVLYWVANNVLSIAQQWYITRIVVKA